MEAKMKFRHIRFMGYRVATVIAVGVSVLTSGCSSGAEENFDRSDLFTEIASGINRNAPSDISGLQGQATYRGAAAADFGGFRGTADSTLTANFKDRSITGSLTAWEDLDPLNFKLDGQVQLSNGTISDNGSFTSQMAGNIERTAQNGLSTPDLMVFQGTAQGQIYNSVQGATASHLDGSFTGDKLGGGEVSGSFVARQ